MDPPAQQALESVPTLAYQTCPGRAGDNYSFICQTEGSMTLISALQWEKGLARGSMQHLGQGRSSE